MAFNIPNAPAAFVPQAKVSSQDFHVITDAAHGNGVVLTDLGACLVTQRAAGANLSIDVAAGDIVFEGAVVAVTAGNLVVSAAHATNPRRDIVSVTGAGVKVITAGTPALAPLPPAIPEAGGVRNIVLAFVDVPATDTAITSAQITDKRMSVNTPGGAAIANDSVTYAKMQNISAASRLLGRGSAAGSGDPQEIVLGTNLTMTGTTLSATGGGGGGTVTTTGTPATGNLTQFSGTTSITAGNLSGDVFTSGALVTTISTGVVSYTKMQDVSAASRLLGRGSAAGAGDPQEITLGTNLSMSGTTLNATGGGGSTPTGTGFRHVTAGTEDAAAALVTTADVTNDQITYPKLQNVSAASRLLGRGAAAGAGDPEEIILGSGLTMTGTTLSAPTGGGGTVTTTGTPAGGNLTQFSSGTVITNGNLSGDVTTSGTLATTIANNAVTYAKQQDVSAASKLLGRGDSGAGDPQEITLGTGLAMSGITLNATGGGGGAPTTADYLVRTADAGLSAERVVTDTATVTWDWATPGQAKANATGGGGSSDIFAIVAADVVHATNSITLSDITGLTFNTTASATELWQVEILLLTHCNVSGGTTADYKFGWSVSGAQTIRWGGNTETGVATTATQLTAGTQATTLAYGSGSNIDGLVRLLALVKSNGAAGAVQLRFAQNTIMTGGIVTIRADSFMIAKKIRS